MVSLHFQDVSKYFGKTAAVSGFNLDINAGELFFLLGPSGCGKTTCLRMVAGFLAPDSGALRFNERAMNAVPPHLRNTGMVFQNYALWPHLSVRGNVEYGLRARKVKRDEMRRRTDEALRMVQLFDLADRFPNQLSGGQQQRVALARALVIRPDVLLLDEPLSNLDAQLRLEMRREIKRLHDETQTTALYVTHDQNEALSVADRIGVMRGGTLQQIGTPRELYRLPQTRFVAGFLGESNFLPGVLTGFDAREMRVQTAAGELVAARQDTRQWHENQNVFCSIRPEAWQLLETDTASTRSAEKQNSFAAKLENVTYLGEVEQWQMQLVGGRETQGEAEEWRRVRVSRLNPLLQIPPSGAEFALHVAPHDVVVLDE